MWRSGRNSAKSIVRSGATPANRKERIRERWTNEAAHILWNSLVKNNAAGASIGIFIDGWNPEYFREGEGCKGETLSLGAGQKQIDIAVVRHGSPGEVLALIEVEEKRAAYFASEVDLMADADHLLAGHGVTIRGRADWLITPRTRLGVLFYGPTEGIIKRASDVEKHAREEQARLRKDGVPNAWSELITVRSFGQFNEEGTLRQQLELVMDRPLACETACANKRCLDPDAWSDDPARARVGVYVRREFHRLRERLRRPDLTEREAAEIAEVNYGTLRSVLAERAKDPAMVKALADRWGFPVIDFHIRASGKLTKNDLIVYVRSLLEEPDERRNLIGCISYGSSEDL